MGKFRSFAFILLFLSPIISLAQESINTAGNTDTVSGYVISYSIGQLFFNNDTDSFTEMFEGVQVPVEITLPTSAKQELKLNENIQFIAFPNPTQSFVCLKANSQLLEEIRVDIFGVDGKLVFDNGKVMSYDLSFLKAGTYYLKVTYGSEVYIIKLIKSI